MRALSLTRPWTTAVLALGKDVENRNWRTSYRGPLIIHGAKSWEPAALEFADIILGCPALMPDKDKHPTGYLGVCQLVSIHHTDDCKGKGPNGICSPWAMSWSLFHWVLADPKPFGQPINGPGQLNVFTPPDHVANQARVLLG